MGNVSSKNEESAGRVGKLRASYYLFVEGLDLLRKDPKILSLALFANVLSFVFTTVIFLLYLWINVSAVGAERFLARLDIPNFETPYSLALVTGFVFVLINVLYQTVIMHMVSSRIEGKTVTVRAAMEYAEDRGAIILEWAIVSSIVMTVFSLLSDVSKGWLTSATLMLFIIWVIGVFLVVPAIATERTNLPNALVCSFRAMKNVWVETVVAGIILGLLSMIISFGAIALFVLVFAFFVGMLGSVWAASPILPALLLALILVAILFFSFIFAMHSILRLVLYRYSVHGCSMHLPRHRSDFVLSALRKNK